MATERAAKTFEQPSRITSKGKNWDATKYCYFHKDFGHDMNSCLEFKRQIEEAVKFGQLAHLVKGIEKGKEKSSYAQKEKETAPNEAPILMVRWGGPSQKRKEVEKELHTVWEITFPSIAD